MTDLLKYGKSLFRKIKNLGEKALNGFGEKDLHQLRICVKKLKALALLISFYDSSIDDTFFRKIKKTFGKSGRIRDLQVLQHHIATISFSDDKEKKELLRTIKSKERTARKAFKRDFENESTGEIKKELFTVIANMSAITMAPYFGFTIQKVMKKIQGGNLPEEEYHELRKDLKELKYNLKLMDEDDKMTLSEIPLESELQKIETMLGEWHDQIMIGQLIQKFIIDKDITEDAARISRLAEKKGRSLLSKVKHYFNHHKMVLHA